VPVVRGDYNADATHWSRCLGWIRLGRAPADRVQPSGPAAVRGSGPTERPPSGMPAASSGTATVQAQVTLPGLRHKPGTGAAAHQTIAGRPDSDSVGPD